MDISSELDKLIRQNAKDESAYLALRQLLTEQASETNEPPDYLHQLHQVSTVQYANLNQMFQAYIRVGHDILQIDFGSVNQIENNTYRIRARYPNQDTEKDVHVLNRTLCQHVIKNNKTIVFNEISQNNRANHYQGRSPSHEYYIGTPIRVNNKVWGTLCFYGDRAKDRHFSQSEIEFIELMAISISSALNDYLSQQQKQQAERRYQLIFENIDVPVLIYDTDTYKIVEVNPAAIRFYGYDHDTFLKLTIADINMLPISDIEERLASSQKASVPYAQFPHRLSNGEIREVQEYSNKMDIDHRSLRLSIIHDHSDQYASEVALKHSEANLRAILDNASQLMFLVDETANIVTMNRAAVRMTMLIDGDVIATSKDSTLHKYYPHANKYLVSDYINRALKGHSITHDVKLTLSNNQPLYLHYRYVPVKTSDDTIIGVCVTGQDVTSLKLSEEELAYERNILRSLIDNLPDSIYIKDEQARILTANQRYIQRAKASKLSEIKGKTAQDLFPDYGQTYYQDDLNVIKTGKILSHDEPFIETDGSQGLLETTKIPLKDEKEKVVGLVGIGRDITKQRAIEQGMRDNEEKFHQLITHIPEAFWIFDVESQMIIYASDNYQDMFGISIEDRLDDVENYFAVVHPEDHDRVRAGMEKQANGEDLNYEIRLVNDPDIGVRWVNIRIYPIVNEAGEVYRIAGIASDITQKKRAEEAMLEVRAQNERINILSNFFRDASHEFITPLSVIKNSLYIMNKTKETDRYDDHVKLIQEQVRDISELVETLVLMSRLDSGAEVTLSIVNMNVLITPYKQIFSQTYPDRENDLRVSTRKSVPPILGSRTYIMQALRNLIDNAVRYSEVGSLIFLTTYHDGEYVVIEVEDRGIGISEDELPKIFRRFYRIDEAHSTRGFGLGLTIVQSIVQRHNGKIEVESRLGQGSTFRIKLPTLSVIRD